MSDWEDHIDGLIEEADREEERIRSNPLLAELLEFEEMLECLVYVQDGRHVVRLYKDRKPRLMTWNDAAAFYAASWQTHNRRRVLNIELWKESPMRRSVETITHAIGRPQICEAPDGRTAVNLWTAPPPPKTWDEELAFVIDEHIRYLIPEPSEAELFWRWLAWIHRHPDQPVQWGVLMTTPTFGTGRNTLFNMLDRVWPGEVARNVKLGKVIGGGFNGRLSGRRLACVDELAVDGASPYLLAAQVREAITEEIRGINIKYGAEYDEFNSCHWLMASNHIDGLPMPENDRRLFVINNPVEKMPAAYYDMLQRAMKRIQFSDTFRMMLDNVDLDDFSPGAAPPMNEAKETAISATRNTLTREADSLLEHWPSRQWIIYSHFKGCLSSSYKSIEAQLQRWFDQKGYSHSIRMRLTFVDPISGKDVSKKMNIRLRRKLTDDEHEILRDNINEELNRAAIGGDGTARPTYWMKLDELIE